MVARSVNARILHLSQPDRPGLFAPVLRVHAPVGSSALLRVERLKRQGPALMPGPFQGQPDVLGLDLTAGCGHRCPFCLARAAPTGDGAVAVYEDTASQLEDELTLRRFPPRAVVISPSTDPFPPLAEVQAEAARVVELLASRGVEAWLMTRGLIRPSALRALAACRERVRVTVGLTTLDRDIQRAVEPLAAPPRLRLRQLARLRALGIPAQAALEPLIPGLTDTRVSLTAMLEALATAGVRQVVAGYLALRPGVREEFLQSLRAKAWDGLVLDAFADARLLRFGSLPPAYYLSKHTRQRGYAALMALAAGLGITVRVNGITNPDFQGPHRPDAHAGPTPHPIAPPQGARGHGRQLLLPGV